MPLSIASASPSWHSQPTLGLPPPDTQGHSIGVSMEVSPAGSRLELIPEDGEYRDFVDLTVRETPPPARAGTTRSPAGGSGGSPPTPASPGGRGAGGSRTSPGRRLAASGGGGGRPAAGPGGPGGGGRPAAGPGGDVRPAAADVDDDE